METGQDNQAANHAHAKLLYQAGAWISAMDQSGGRKSDEAEREAIYRALQKFSFEKGYQNIKPVFETALMNNRGWNEWSRDLSDFTKELRAQAPEMPLELRQCFYDLAYSVAIRYQERSFINVFFTGLVVSFRNFISPQTRNTEFRHYIKISGPEKNALNELADILQMPQRVID